MSIDDFIHSHSSWIATAVSYLLTKVFQQKNVVFYPQEMEVLIRFIISIPTLHVWLSVIGGNAADCYLFSWWLLLIEDFSRWQNSEQKCDECLWGCTFMMHLLKWAEWCSSSVSAMSWEQPGLSSRICLREKIWANDCTMWGQNNWGNWGSLGVMKLWVAWD